MTIQSALQSAAVRLVGRKPSVFLSASTPLELELVDLANETAKALLASHDWQALTRLFSINGDGSTIAFDLPSDYDRLPKVGSINSESWQTWRYTPARDLDQWFDFNNGLGIASPGSWIILDGKFQIYPAPAIGDEANFYYISKNLVRGSDGTLKPEFTADDDTFLLDERLITLGVIWRWRQQKQLAYADDEKNFDVAEMQAIGKDKGPRLLKSGPARFPGDVRIAYPGSLG